MSKRDAVEKCEVLCSGSYQHGLAVCRRHGAGADEAEKAHARAHRLTHKRLSLPGGAVGLLAEVEIQRRDLERLAAEIAELGARGQTPSGAPLRDRLARHARMKADIEKREAFLATLPPEARKQPAQMVVAAEEAVAAARATGDRDAIVKAAAKLAAARKDREDALAGQRAVNNEIHNETLAAHKALASALNLAFDAVVEKVAEQFSDGAAAVAPELINRVLIEKAMRAAAEIGAAVAGLGFDPPTAAEILDVVPELVRRAVAADYGMSLLRHEAAM